MASRLFEGSGVALVTPFAEQEIDEATLRELIRFHLREGTDALVINGSTGEAAVMPPAAGVIAAPPQPNQSASTPQRSAAGTAATAAGPRSG
jgi:hypothetical protein